MSPLKPGGLIHTHTRTSVIPEFRFLLTLISPIESPVSFFASFATVLR